MGKLVHVDITMVIQGVGLLAFSVVVSTGLWAPVPSQVTIICSIPSPQTNRVWVAG